jgi:PAS domain S-box-containing protein
MENQKIYNAVIQNLPVGFSIIDKNGTIVDFNPAAAEITGYSRDEIIGELHFEILHGTSDRDACPVMKHALSRKEQAIAEEATIRRMASRLLSPLRSFRLLMITGIFQALLNFSGTSVIPNGSNGSRRIFSPCSPTI